MPANPTTDPTTALTLFQVISFVASIASLILAVGAIWLSIVFFRMSNEASKATTEAAKGIAASVERLEKLFDKLYSDTFSMMRDTVSDMRKHMWPEDGLRATENEAEQKADEKIAEITHRVDQQLERVLARQDSADQNTTALHGEIRELFDNAIRTSRAADQEAREETDRSLVLAVTRLLNRTKPDGVKADEIVNDRRLANIGVSRAIDELRSLQARHLVEFSTEQTLGPETIVRMVAPRSRPRPEQANNS